MKGHKNTIQPINDTPEAVAKTLFKPRIVPKRGRKLGVVYNEDCVRSRSSECKVCRKKSRLSMKGGAAYKRENPPPKEGDTFECPLCKDIFTVNKSNVNLDHDSRETGKPRGYVCANCNTGMGKMGDDISVLARAILWLSKPLKSLLVFC